MAGRFRLARLSRVRAATLITSRYALAEAERNLETDEQRSRLAAFRQEHPVRRRRRWRAAFPDSVKLVEKDAPILLAAIEGRATHLLTGDLRHFADLYGKSISGVKVLRPAEYLKSI